MIKGRYTVKACFSSSQREGMCMGSVCQLLSSLAVLNLSFSNFV